jgi:hypothetical protein
VFQGTDIVQGYFNLITSRYTGTGWRKLERIGAFKTQGNWTAVIITTASCKQKGHGSQNDC